MTDERSCEFRLFCAPLCVVLELIPAWTEPLGVGVRLKSDVLPGFAKLCRRDGTEVDMAIRPGPKCVGERGEDMAVIDPLGGAEIR